MVALKRAVGVDMSVKVDLSSLASDTSSQLDVLRHDGHSLGVDGTQVGVFEQTN